VHSPPQDAAVRPFLNSLWTIVRSGDAADTFCLRVKFLLRDVIEFRLNTSGVSADDVMTPDSVTVVCVCVCRAKPNTEPIMSSVGLRADSEGQGSVRYAVRISGIN